MKKLLYIGLILFVGFGSLLQLSAYVHNDLYFKNHPYIKLVPPPPIVLGADYGSPLVTVDIGLFAYYEAADWDLNDVIPAFHNYTQYSNYVDGYVRVWSDVEGTSFEGDQLHSPPATYGYIDVSVRVRSDGWILAWIEDSQNKAFICHWGRQSGSAHESGYPTDYSTCLGRAIYRVYHNAGVSWVGYDEIFYYDYEYPDATRLSIFGRNNFDQVSPPNEEHFYFTIPSGVTIEAFWVAYMGYAGGGSDGVFLDGGAVEVITGSEGWIAEDLTGSISVATRHDVKVYHDASTQSGISCSAILWTS